MKWFDASKKRPIFGKHVFLWDRGEQKQIMVYAGWEEDRWYYNPRYPFWAYVEEGNEPVDVECKAALH